MRHSVPSASVRAGTSDHDRRVHARSCVQAIGGISVSMTLKRDIIYYAIEKRHHLLFHKADAE